MNKPELLLPAGNIEKLDYTCAYGADAVYFGLGEFSLRSMKKGELINEDNIKQAVDTAHKQGAKAYATINVYAFNDDIKLLYEKLDILKDANPDAIIFSDFGIYKVLKDNLPNIPLHLSTQANTLNYESVKFWQDLGVERIVLARELSISQISEIKNKVPDIELECFVHGAQCMSMSGRCLLSDYMSKNERKANQGNCTQPCRWNYKLMEETRPGIYLDITEYDRGTFILSPKDLCLIEYIPQLIDAGVDSFKVEGRTKSVYYASAVAKTYRKAIDDYINGNNFDKDFYINELMKVGNRGFTSGFFIDDMNKGGYSYEVSKGIAGATFYVQINGAEDEYLTGIVKNQIKVGDAVEFINPKERFEANIIEIKDIYDNLIDIANTNAEVRIKLDKKPQNFKYALIRGLLAN